MKTRSRTLTAAVALATAAGLAACTSGEGRSGGDGDVSAGDPVTNAGLVSNNPQDRNTLEQGGSLTLSLADWTTNFNSAHVDGRGSEFGRVVNATDPVLYNWRPDGTMQPRSEFLTAMPQVEQRGTKTVVTYDLNPRARWNDGTTIDHTAFESTWKAHRAPVDRGGYNNATTAGYEDIESVARGSTPSQVVVTFAKPYYPATEVFQTLVHPKLGAGAEAFNTLAKTDFHPELRAGPYTLDSVDQTTKTIVLKPNPNWWGDKPLLDRVVFRQMESSAEVPAFKNGEIDVIDGVSGVANKAAYAQIQGATGLELRRSQRTATNVHVLNGKAAGLTDLNVRKAIWQALDREEWKRVRYAGLDYTEKPVDSAVYFGFQPEAENNMPVAHDPAAAQETLRKAGYVKGDDGYVSKNGTPLVVDYTYFGDDPMQTALAQLAQNQLKAVGINLTLDNRPGAAFGPAMEKRDFGLLAMGWNSDSSSPLSGMCQLMCSVSGSNYSGLGTPELDEKMKSLGTISDKAAQAKAINAVEKEWMGRTYGQMPISNGPVIAAYRQGVANLGPALFASMHPQWENVGWQRGTRRG